MRPMKRLPLLAIVLAALALAMSGWALQRSYDEPDASPATTSTTVKATTTTAAAKLVAVPTVVGKSGVDAAVALKRAGLAPRVDEAPSVSVAKNKVISIDPVAGTQVPRGTIVRITLSSGPP